MQKAIVRRTFDVVRNQRQEPIYAAKGDYGARYIQGIITVDGVPYAIPENAVVTINAFRRDGKTNRFKGEVNADGSVIVPITQWMLEILGMVDCTISVVEEGGMLTTENFYVVANESSTNVEVSPDDPQYDLLTEVLLNEGTRQKQFSDMVEYINSLEQGKQGPAGPAGIHIGPEAPTDGQVAWIDTNEEPSAEEGGANFDIVAKPGQVIAVKAVDVEGKPKEYKAVDLPVHDAPDWNAAEGEAGHVLNRTHYVDEKGVIHKIPNKFIDAEWMATSEKHVDNTIVIPEQSVTTIWNNRQMDIQPGIIYDVHINGVAYPCEALNEDGGIILGNNTSLTMNNLPFCIFWAGGTATSGFFYKNSSVLSGTIYMKVTGHSYEKYNTLPKEYLPEISWNELTDKPFAEDTGDLLFSHTSTFATDNASEKIMGVSLPLTVGAGYWMEINGDMVKCHCESAGTATFAIYDTDGNMWLKKAATILYVYGQTAGTYTYKLYEMEKNIVLDPQYIPSSIARKSDIPEGGGGSASIDVTAQVGQTIIVKEVDADGKPTKWESADYQPRTHWSEFREVQPSTTITPFYYEALGVPMGRMSNFDIVVGNKYKVTFDGVEYTCDAFISTMAGMSAPAFGNTAVAGGANTGEPFAIFKLEGDDLVTAIFFDMNPHTVSIIGEVVTQIPQKYVNFGNAFPYYIEVTGSGTTDDPYTCAETVAQIKSMLDSGREIKARRTWDIISSGVYETDIYNLATTMNGHLQLWFVYQTISKRVLIFTANEGGGYNITDSLD